uniref:Heart development protein with EGF-like domains 1 n=1 Tax=Astyanax mexicanus TaxID=7994 RepID=W5KF16_ASTMX
MLSTGTELSTATVTEWEDPSTVANITNVYPGLDRTERQAETETKKDVTDTTESVSHTDSTYISTTISRAGERTLLSILSNSTSSYTEESSSSEVSPLTVTSEEWKTETTVVGKNSTEGLFSTEGVLSTEADQTRATFENDMTTNASQQETMLPSEPEVTHDSQGTQSHTGQPNVTESSFEATSDGSSSNSTLPFTVVSSSESSSKTESETAADSSTSGTSYTDSSASESSITPAVSPEDSHTNTSQQESETMTTETSTSTVNTEDGKKPESPQTHMDETTIPGLTTAPPTLTTTDDSLSKFLSGQRPFVPQTNHPEETTEVLTTAAGPATHRPWHTEEDTREASTAASSTIASTVFPTTLSSTSTSPAIPPTTHQLQQSTAAKTHTPYVELSTIETTQMLTTPTSEPHPLTTKTPTTHQSSSSSQPVDISTDVSTLHLETSTATPGNTTAHGKHTTVSYSKTAPTRSTAVVTTGKSTDRGSTQEADTTTQISVKSTPTPGVCISCLFCANGGLSVPTSEGGYRCACLPAWKGATCTEDVNECVSSPCPLESECVNTSGSFSCKCPLGYDLEDGRSCTQAKTFLGKFSVNSSLHLSSTSAIPHDLHKEILHLVCTKNLHIFRVFDFVCRNGKELDVSNMFSMSANVTSSEVYRNIQAFLRNCSKPNSRCTLKLHYQLTYQVDSLCRSQKNKCDSQSSVCRDDNGTLYCQCKEGFFKKNPEDTTCRDCGDGFEKDKNDINKIIFKSGDLQMSPYAEFPKSSRVSMEWGRETIEMQENGSTKNLLQMTDIYYSPALRNADLERNGLYPFSGLPGSRHSCIYPAQWNPSFISDDSRRRDYF